jgi:GxxExxY protein
MADIDAINSLTEKIIGCAIEVHKQLGPGLLESIYEQALCCELRERGINYEKQLMVPIVYKGNEIGIYRLDLLVEGEVIVELKSVERSEPLFEAQLLTYLKITGKKLGLLINFNSAILKNGLKRIIL